MPIVKADRLTRISAARALAREYRLDTGLDLA